MPHIPEIIRVFTTKDLLRRGWSRSMIRRHLKRIPSDWWFTVVVPHSCLPTSDVYFWEKVILESASAEEEYPRWGRQALYREQDVRAAEKIPGMPRKLVYRILAA
jgi:hypothetical protein